MEHKFTTENFEAQVLQSDIPVLVDFYADWCGPCKMMAPAVEELAEAYQGKIDVYKVNVDEEPALAVRYKVVSIPTLLLFQKGEVVRSFIGLQSKDTLEACFQEVLG